MKSTTKILLTILFIFSVICNIQLYRGYVKLENKLNHIPSIKFEWEGLERDIPQDGTYIQITGINNDTIYLNNIDE